MTAEVIQWSSLCEKYEKELKNGSAKSKPTSVFDSSEEGQKRWKDLKIRVAEHVSPSLTFCGTSYFVKAK